MDSTWQKGEMAMLKVQQRAAEKGVIVSKPTVDARYDLIVDEASRLLRAQVKWGGRKGSNATGSVAIDFRKGKQRFYTLDEIDIMLIWIVPADVVVRLRPEHFHGKSAIMIRYAPQKRACAARVWMVEDLVW